MVTVHNADDSNSSVKKPFISSIISDKESEFPIPRDDGDGWQAFSGKSTVTMPSPTSVNEPETTYISRLSESFMDNVNRARYFDIAVGVGGDDLTNIVAKTGRTDLLINSAFGNWRKKQYNGIWTLSERIMLMPKETPKVNYSISYSTGDLKEQVLKKGLGQKLSKITETVNELASTVNAVTDNSVFKGAHPVLGERMSLYGKMPIASMSETSQSAGLTSLSFEFRFGQAGMFSGEEEVVKPILAIANIFAIKSSGNAHAFTGPLPTKGHAESVALTATIAVIRDAFHNSDSMSKLFTFGSDDENFAGSIVNTLNNITDALYGVIDTVALAVMSTITTVVAIIGSLIVGPFVCSEVKWSFDFENTDEYGFPCAGNIELNNLAPIRLLTGMDYPRLWGYTIGTGSDSLTAKEKAQLKAAGQDEAEALKIIKG